MEIILLIGPAAALGAGLTIDVAIATLSRFHDKTITFWNWALPIAILHVLFIGVGFTFFWELVRHFPLIAPIIGTGGFLLVTLLIYEVGVKASGKVPYISISKGLATILSVSENSGRKAVVWIAVTLDALVSGPATTILAHQGQWGTLEAIISFLIVGAIVAAATYGAILVSRYFAKTHFHSTNLMTNWLVFGIFLEMVVIQGFGVLSLWGGLSDEADLIMSIIISTAIILSFFALRWNEIYTHQHEEAQETLEGE